MEISNELIFDLRNRIRPVIDGLQFVKSVKVGVPYAKIVLYITVRKELPIPIIHEAIMKLIDEKWHNYEEIRKLLGVDQDYMDTVMSELGRSFISHYGQQLYLTNEGKAALQDMKSVKIEPEFLDDLIINQVDGSILTIGDINLREKINSDAFINPLINIQLEYLIDKEAQIRDFYNKKQLKNQSKTQPTIRDELYRIIKIEKSKILYYEEIMDIYLSEEDNVLEFVFNTGKGAKYDELLGSVVREQLKKHPKLLERMFDTEYFYRNRLQSVDMVPKCDFTPMYVQRKNLEHYMNNFLSSQNSDSEAFKQLYLSDRAMFYREYRDFILDLPNNYIKELIIVSDHFYDLIGNDQIFSVIESILKKSKVYIGYMPGDFNTQRFIKDLKEFTKNNKNLYFKELAEIHDTTILAEPYFLINIYYRPLKIENNILFEEIPMITFSCKDIIESSHTKLMEKFLN